MWRLPSGFSAPATSKTLPLTLSPNSAFRLLFFSILRNPLIISNNNPTIFNKSAKVFCSKGNSAKYLNLLFSSYNLEVRKIISIFKFIKLGPWLNSFFLDPLNLEKLHICIYKIDIELSFFFLSLVIELSLISCSRIFLRKDSIFTLQYILYYYYYYQ